MAEAARQRDLWSAPDDVWAPGGASGVVLVQVHYRYPSVLQLPFASNRLPDGRSLLGAATIFQNEPF